jgi:hypothetical protein
MMSVLDNHYGLMGFAATALVMAEWRGCWNVRALVWSRSSQSLGGFC